MNRRTFLQQTALGGAATALGLSSSIRLDASVRWPVGCFNRPWTTWSFDDTLAQIKAAGYQTTGLLTRTKDEPFIGADATPEYLAKLKQRLAASGLKANMGGAAVAPQRAAGRVDQGSAAADRECRRPRPSLPPHLRRGQAGGVRALLQGHGRRRRGRAGAPHQAGHEAARRRQRRIGGNRGRDESRQTPELQDLVRRRQHHLLHRQGPGRRAEADRASTSPVSVPRTAPRSRATS